MRRISLRSVCAIAGLALVTALTSGCLGQSRDADPSKNKGVKEFSLTIATNAIKGGKNSEGATWIEDWVIPEFVKAQKKKGVTAKVKFQPSGVDDEDYKSKISLDMQSGKGADVVDLDGIWIGEFAESGYIKPLDDVVGGGKIKAWDGWGQIPESVQLNGAYEDKRYGVPAGTDGRVIFFNKSLFAKAGLPADWQPTTWDEILKASRTLKSKLPKVTPIQLNAGTAMGEATTMQGFLPLLAGVGGEVNVDGKWLGDGQQIRDVLDFYHTVYAEELGDPVLQKEAKGRDKSFQQFADGEIAILLEGDYFWRDVIDPADGIAPMKDRDTAVGYAMIPAMSPGAGIRGQDFVSMSGGSARVLNPNSDYPQQAWELLQFMNSAEAIKAELGEGARITARQDVNAEVLSNDPMLTFASEQVLPLTAFRPGLAEYPEVSLALQEATLAVVGGKSAKAAAADYQAKLEKITGGADEITSG
ncbi:MAG: extracellular solute-binding protein [Micromonosporaceae bacterium]|nr:extracellular solute-binding protein [Micromonosporaceae bacterium]